MWTDPIVAQIHQTRADITRKVGDNSHAITFAAQRMAQEAAEIWCAMAQAAFSGACAKANRKVINPVLLCET